jgi:hypothetical protein
VQALQAGIVPSVLISGGSGHSTVHLYKSIRDHPVWHHIPTQEGRHEAEVGGEGTGQQDWRDSTTGGMNIGTAAPMVARGMPSPQGLSGSSRSSRGLAPASDPAMGALSSGRSNVACAISWRSRGHVQQSASQQEGCQCCFCLKTCPGCGRAPAAANKLAPAQQ